MFNLRRLQLLAFKRLRKTKTGSIKHAASQHVRLTSSHLMYNEARLVLNLQKHQRRLQQVSFKPLKN